MCRGIRAGGNIDSVQCARHGGDRFHGGAHPQHGAGGHPALDTAGAVGCAMNLAVNTVQFIVCLAAESACGGEPVTDLHALNGLNAHEGTGKPRIEAAIPVHI